MARVNLEERFFAEGRLFRLARSLGFPVQTVMGMLAFLWHDSQEMGEYEGDATSICEWMRLHEIQTSQTLNSQWEIEKLEESVIEALVKCRYISQISEGVYEIHGNREQLEKLDKWAQRAKKAADARWQHKEDATSIAQASPKAMRKHMQSDALQFNSVQYNTIQKEEVSEPLTISAPPLLAVPKPKRTRKKIAYSPEFEKVWGQYPQQYQGSKLEAAQEFERLGADDLPAFERAIGHVNQAYQRPQEDWQHLKHLCRFIAKEDWRAWEKAPPASHGGTNTKPQTKVHEDL